MFPRHHVHWTVLCRVPSKTSNCPCMSSLCRRRHDFLACNDRVRKRGECFVLAQTSRRRPAMSKHELMVCRPELKMYGTKLRRHTVRVPTTGQTETNRAEEEQKPERNSKENTHGPTQGDTSWPQSGLLQTTAPILEKFEDVEESSANTEICGNNVHARDHFAEDRNTTIQFVSSLRHGTASQRKIATSPVNAQNHNRKRTSQPGAGQQLPKPTLGGRRTGLACMGNTNDKLSLTRPTLSWYPCPEYSALDEMFGTLVTPEDQITVQNVTHF